MGYERGTLLMAHEESENNGNIDLLTLEHGMNKFSWYQKPDYGWYGYGKARWPYAIQWLIVWNVDNGASPKWHS